MGEFVAQAECARRINRHRSQITRALQEGLPSVGEGRALRIDVDVALAWFASRHGFGTYEAKSTADDAPRKPKKPKAKLEGPAKAIRQADSGTDDLSARVGAEQVEALRTAKGLQLRDRVLAAQASEAESKAQIAAVRARAAEGEYIDRAPMLDRVERLMGQFRQHFLGVAVRRAVEVAGALGADPATTRAELQRVIDAELNALADGVRALAE